MPLYKWCNVKQLDSAACWGGRTLLYKRSERFHSTYRKAFHLGWKERLCLESYAKGFFFFLHRCTLFNISGSFQIQHAVIMETEIQSKELCMTEKSVLKLCDTQLYIQSWSMTFTHTFVVMTFYHISFLHSFLSTLLL